MHVRDVAVRDVVAAKPTDTVQSVVEKMAAGDFDRIPVVDEETGRRLVGIVSTTDILSLERLVEPTLGDDEDV
ncbi:MAG: CBS domain-containing protein [Anaerosomatales bacterium]|nr:CBS domain-containing protein [Anaerosomatales bacterium]